MGLLDKIKGSFNRGGQRSANELVNAVLRESEVTWDIDPKDCKTFTDLSKEPREKQKQMALALVKKAKGFKSRAQWKNGELDQFRTTVLCLIALLKRNLPWNESDLILLIDWRLETKNLWGYLCPASGTIQAIKNFSKSHPISEKLKLLGKKLSGKLLESASDISDRARAVKLADAVGVKPDFPLVIGDKWACAALNELRAIEDDDLRSRWIQLLHHCQITTSGKPTGKWKKRAEQLLENTALLDDFKNRVLNWFCLVNTPVDESRSFTQGRYTHEMDPWQLAEQNQDVLKGLVWCCSLHPSSDIIRSLSMLCISAFKKITGIGPRAIRLGNACIYALGSLEGADALAQLALLKVKIRNRGVQNQIAKALQIAADREGVTTDELEEMSVPEYGLTDIGVLEEALGGFTARLSIVGSNSTKLEWLKADGKVQKSVPAVVKNDYSGELKELRSTAKDIQKMLPAIRERIDNFYLQQRSWTYSVWCERYLNHPLVGFFARRLIWLFENKGETFTVFFHAGKWVDHHGNEVEALSENAKDFSVRLWHPLDEATSEVLAWRDWIEEQLIQQPFKQAHREIYLLTAAEENTHTYSNRYAAHIIKQHQFNALCQARGWRNSLRLMVDDEYPPASKSLERWGIRAEFWIEGVGDDYGTDTTESGSYLYLATDQVRFYPIDTALSTAHAGGGGYGPGWRGEVGDPLPLADIPKLVFSEIMRDVDLFIGVSSVGNDPAWADGGPNGLHRDYWHSYSFGELSGTAKTRKEILERLLPRLKIANQSHIDGKFLVVEGSKHAYKIHLGSGNILMSPSDQYLCIVPNAAQRKGGDKLFLPFEGDRVLAIILSKAFMLAEDQKIKDATILAQIGE